jgi:hypothetical protein
MVETAVVRQIPSCQKHRGSPEDMLEGLPQLSFLFSSFSLLLLPLLDLLIRYALPISFRESLYRFKFP